MPFQLIVRTPEDQDFPDLSKREWGGECIIGRGQASQYRLPDKRRLISSRHAKISQQADEYILMDIGSTNGTLLNGAKIDIGKPYPLAEHDQIGIGDFVLEFVMTTTAQTLVGLDTSDETIFAPPASAPTETIVEQLQQQYAQMMHLPAMEREAFLVEHMREALAPLPSVQQEELLSVIEKTFGDPEIFGDIPGPASAHSPPVLPPLSVKKPVEDVEVSKVAPSFPAGEGTEQEQVLALLLDFLNSSMKGRRQFQKDFEVPVTKILGLPQLDLKWAETSFQIRSFLFDPSGPIPFPERLHQLQQVLEDLTLHPLGIIAGLHECIRFLLTQLDPISLEIECNKKKKGLGANLMTMGLFGHHPAWESFKEKHHQLSEGEKKAFIKLFGPQLEKGYIRVHQTKSSSSKP